MDVQAYDAVRERIGGLLRAGNGDAPVPACPGWRVREVVAHLTGLCEDWVEGRLEGYASEAWTEAQVTRFAGATVDEILNRWQVAATAFTLLDDDPSLGPPARWAFGDAITHEADIRGALGAEPVPHDAVLVALKGAVARWREVLAAAATPPLLLRATDAREWWLGRPEDGAAVEAETMAYEIFRALAGRRSAAQVRAWHWSASPDPFLTAGLPYPFRWSPTDIVD